MYKRYAIFLLVLLVFPQISSFDARAQYSNHPNLFVSAENSVFQNYFSGAMVVEVIIKGDNTQLDQAQGEPNVNINGRQLHMAQGSDGYWYAFFANTQMAQQASAISLSGGTRGQNLDFGDFCSGSTPSSVLGVDFSQTDGVAIPPNSGLSGTTHGLSSFTVCSGNAISPSTSSINVLRFPPSLNSNPKVPVGQIGINPNVWPVIQLFTFSNNVHIEYNGATGTQSVDLTYSNIPNISINLDRQFYPQGSDVIATINDIQLNEDPTSADSWTFNVGSNLATFYQAFPETGGGSTTGLVNLGPSLSSLGFQDNGKVSMNLGNVVTLKTNSIQTSSSITVGGTPYNNLVTFVETGPNTGVFESSDASSTSTIGTLENAPRDQSGSIQYNLQAVSIVSGTATASLTLGNGQGQFSSGQRETVTLTDPGQVRNSKITEQLNVFRSSVLIPTLMIGNPVTLGTASNVNFYQSSSGFLSSIPVTSSVPDPNSAILVIDTRPTATTNFAKITINLGITALTLKNLFIDVSQPNSNGNNWLNYDLRSFQQQLGVSSFTGTSMTLYFGSLGGPSVTILPAGSISSGNGLVQITDSAITSVESQPSSSPVFLEINFGSSGGKISNESDTQPIVFDLFSFGTKNSQTINNAVYRAELQETSAGSGVFTGTIEYTVPNQINQFDPSLIESLRTFGSSIKFLSTGQMVEQNGNAMRLSVTSVQAGQSTTTTSQNNLPTHTGIVTLDSANYRIGSTVTITVIDPDLAGDANTIQTFTTVNDPNSPAVDTVGDNSGNILLEVWIKGFRFQHCTINGQTYGGLGATGFTLTETGPGTGVFEGSFKMPSKICSEDGNQLISPVGGSVEAWYHDPLNAYGAPEVIHSIVAVSVPTNSSPMSQQQYIPKISQSTQISTSDGRPVLENPRVGQTINFNGQISNNDIQNSQKISYILQIKNSQGQVVYLNWIDDTVNSMTNVNEKIQWIPIEPGVYSAEIYIWDGMNSLIPLTEQKEFRFQVL
ncbi:MAG: peptidase [Nitrosotalea sp.]